MNRPLRVLQLNSMLSGGGTDEQTLRLAEGLVREKVKVGFVYPTGAALERRLIGTGADLFALPRDRAGWLAGAVAVARRWRPDIVHAHHGRDYWPAVLIRVLGAPRGRLVLSRHLAKSPGAWTSRRWLLGACDALVAVSEAVASILKNGLAQPESRVRERHWRPPMRGDFRKIRVIPCGVDTERFRERDASSLRAEWGLKPGNFAFGVVGAYDFPVGKGQVEFLQAAARVAKEVSEARFLVVGRGTMREKLQDDIRALGLEGRAWLTAYVEEMPEAMSALDALVHPALGTEAFGLVVAEAMLCGRPVIASELDGIPEVFRAGGLGRLVPPESVTALAEAMREVAQQGAPDAATKAAARAGIEKAFGMEHLAARHAALYEELVGGGGGS
ncbi:MAG: hypothetical protein OHK005_16840 [Candidatus Methylacidiphilales bacterium]